MKVHSVIVYALLLAHFVIVGMEVSVQLYDGTTHLITKDELELSATLLSKKLLREKITQNDIVRWGYDATLHEQLHNAPLYLTNVHTSSFDLFRKALPLSPKKFVSFFKKLTAEQQDALALVASERQLGVPQLSLQINEILLPSDVIQNNIAPHFITEDIVNHLYNSIVVHNVQQKALTQITEPLPGDGVELEFNATFNAFMMFPTKMIKNNSYFFNGRVGRISRLIENKPWTLVTRCSKGEHLYYFTPSITDEECAQQEIKRFPPHKYFLWTLDKTSGEVLHKQLIECEGAFEVIQFSPDGCYLALSYVGTEDKPDKSLMVVKLDEKLSCGNYRTVLLPVMTKEIIAMSFNAQSTVLATGSFGKESANTITLWDMRNEKALASLSGHQRYIGILQFNHSGSRMLSVSHAKTFLGSIVLKVILWDTSDYLNVQELAHHHLHSFQVTNQCYFSPDDKRIAIIMNDRTLIILDGINGEAVASDQQTSPRELSTTGLFSRNSAFFVSTLLNQSSKHSDNTVLYDVCNGTILGTLVERQMSTCGVGFTHSGRHVVTVASDGTADGHSIITTTLFDKETKELLQWLKKDTLLIQKYALYCVYRAEQEEIASDLSKKLLMNMIGNATDRDEKVQELLKLHLHR